MRTLQLNDSGSDVEQLQSQLNQLGFNSGTVDGIFGQKTKSAVEEFQKSKGLSVDGIAGAETQDELFHPSAHQIALGIDVHNLDNDGNTIDWQLVNNSNISFAFAKATEGANWTDNKFDSNWQGMKQAGLIRGAYHFFRANKTAEEQAANFLKKVKNGLEFNDLPPVLDVELADKDPKGKEWKFIASSNQERSVSQRLDLVRHWLQKVEEATGRRPIIYTYTNFWKEFMDDSTELTEYPLWIANYTSKSQLKIPANNWGGKGYTIWQNTQSGSVNGVSGHVDRNRFNGSLEQLIAFVNNTKVANKTTVA